MEKFLKSSLLTNLEKEENKFRNDQNVVWLLAESFFFFIMVSVRKISI